jgi:hypothetical protein
MVGRQWNFVRGKGEFGAQRVGRYSVLRGIDGLSEWQQRSQLMADVRKSSIFIVLENTGTLNTTGYLITINDALHDVRISAAGILIDIYFAISNFCSKQRVMRTHVHSLQRPNFEEKTDT